MKSLRDTLALNDRFFSLEPFFNFGVGFDRLFDDFERLNKTHWDNYPPYNIYKESDGSYSLTIALAGFSKDNVEVLIGNNNTLTVKTVDGDSKQASPTEGFIRRGIANRSFVRTWELDSRLVVESAEMVDGLLTIKLKQETVPTNVKQIPILVPTNAKQLEAK